MTHRFKADAAVRALTQSGRPDQWLEIEPLCVPYHTEPEDGFVLHKGLRGGRPIGYEPIELDRR